MNHTMKIENEDEAIVFSAHIGEIGQFGPSSARADCHQGRSGLETKTP